MKRLLALLFFLASPVYGAVAFRAVTTQNNTTPGTSATVSVTTQAGDFLVVTIAYATSIDVVPTSSAVTFNGDALTRRANVDPASFNFLAVETWTLKNPDVGTFNLVATYAQASTTSSISALMYTGADDFKASSEVVSDLSAGISNGGTASLTPSVFITVDEIIVGNIMTFDSCQYDVVATGSHTQRAAGSNVYDTNKSIKISDKPGNGTTTTLDWQNNSGGLCRGLLNGIALTAESAPTETPTPTLTPTPSHTPTHTPTNTPTNTFTPSNTPTPTKTFTPTNTFTPSLTPTATMTNTPQATPNQTPIPRSCFSVFNASGPTVGGSCEIAGFQANSIQVYSATGSTAVVVIDARVDAVSPWVPVATVTNPTAGGEIVELERNKYVRARVTSISSGSVYALVARYNRF